MEYNDINVLTVGNVAKIMKTGRNKSSEIFNMKDFPAFRVRKSQSLILKIGLINKRNEATIDMP